MIPANEKATENDLAAKLGVGCPYCPDSSGIRFAAVREFTIRMEANGRMVVDARLELTLCSSCSGVGSLPIAVQRLINRGETDDIPF